jgi:MscS family membrane protein
MINHFLLAASFWESLDLDGLWRGNSLAAWLLLAASVVVALLAGWLLAGMLGFLALRWERIGMSGRARTAQGLPGPLALALLALGLNVGIAGLRMAPPLERYAWDALLLLYSMAVLWFAYNAVDLVGLAIRRIGRTAEAAGECQIELLVSRTLRGLLIVVGVLFVAQAVFGWQIGAWLAGLGIAGVAISLAAQDSLKQLFASLAILLDRSFQLGDHIISSGYDGTVEDVGFRSTKLRTTAGNLVTIPNSTVMNNPIENLSRRPASRRTISLAVPASTPVEKLRPLLAALSAVFDEEAIRGPVRPMVDGVERPPEVRFDDLRDNQYKLTVTYWYASSAQADYAAHAERVNLRIAEEMQAAVGGEPRPGS